MRRLSCLFRELSRSISAYLRGVPCLPFRVVRHMYAGLASTTCYGKRQHMDEAFDIATIARGARIRRSPYFEATQRYGCKGYTVYNHMYLPNHYDDPVKEYWRLVHDVTLWDVSVERQVEITGPDAFDFTNMLTPRDLSQCRVGQGKYVLITAEDGGIINDPVLLRLGKDHFWLALADSDVLLWAKGVAVRCGMSVEIREPDVSPLQVQGPKSKFLIKDLFGDKAAGLSYYHFVESDLSGIPVVVTRTGWTGGRLRNLPARRQPRSGIVGEDHGGR